MVLLRGPFGDAFGGMRAAQAALMRPLARAVKLVHVLVVKPKPRQDAGLRSIPFPIFHKLPLFEAPKRRGTEDVEIAGALSLSTRTVRRDWDKAGCCRPTPYEADGVMAPAEQEALNPGG